MDDLQENQMSKAYIRSLLKVDEDWGISNGKERNLDDFGQN